MVQQALDAVCDQVEGCETVVFCDLSTRMVLLSNSATNKTRDALNVICAQAADCLSTGRDAIVGTPEQFLVFLRSKHDPNDALSCVCAIETDIVALMDAMAACLDAIGGGADAT